MVEQLRLMDWIGIWSLVLVAGRRKETERYLDFLVIKMQELESIQILRKILVQFSTESRYQFKGNLLPELQVVSFLFLLDRQSIFNHSIKSLTNSSLSNLSNSIPNYPGLHHCRNQA